MNRSQRRKQQKVIQSAPSSKQDMVLKVRELYFTQQFEECEALSRRLLSMDMSYAPAWNFLGLGCRHQQKIDEALKAFENATRYDGHYVQGFYNLGDLLVLLQRYAEAIPHFLKVLELQHGEPNTLRQLSECYYKTGDFTEALRWGKISCRTTPENLRSWQCVLSVYRHPQAVIPRDEVFETFLAECLKDPHHSTDLMKTVLYIHLCRRLPGIPELCNFAHQGRAEEISQAYHDGSLIKALQHPLILPTLHYGVIPLMEMELLLTHVRRLLARDALEGKGVLTTAEKQDLLLVLSTQCLLNEHVYDLQPEDRQLHVMLAKLASDIPPSLDNSFLTLVLALGMYQRLEREKWALELSQLPKNSLPSAMQDFLREFLEESITEMGIKLTIPSLTPISAGVSSYVREQYEANPYPRWRYLHRVEPHDARTYMKRLFPTYDVSRIKIDGSCKIFIAGSGTGKHPLGSTLRFTGAETLAIDLSRSSLAYAERKRRELGVENLTLMQGDILMLDEVPREYDIVESSGVLHHMEDPLQGWEILTRKLKRGGLMNIGLYSQLARQDIAAMRERIARDGIGEDADSIRTLRQKIMATPDAGHVFKFMRQSDFFSLSECRDLLFHRQEHQFTLPQIEEILKHLGLEFIGFELGNPLAISNYKEMFPQERHMNSLRNWHELEKRYPQTFAGMYQFWLLKP